MAKIQIKRGQQSDVQNLVLAPGELAVALDSGNVYVGTDTGKVHINSTGGTADEAEKLKNIRAFSVTGDATAPAVNFDGTGNVELVLSLPAVSGLTAGTYAGITVNAKGQVVGARALTAADIPQLSTSKISGLGTAATKNTGTASGNIPVLGADGKLDTSVIPAIALSDIFTVENEAEMLGLTAQTGDVAIRTDENKTYILSAEPASVKANWKQILTPAASVQSVNGKTGVVTLTAEDVGATDENVKVETISVTGLSPSDKYNIPLTAQLGSYTGALKVRDQILTLTGQAGATLNVYEGLGSVNAAAFTGNAASADAADKLTTARTISLSGGATGSATFDGSANMDISVSALSPSSLSSAVSIAKGGTGATTAAAALTNLGLSATATELNYCDGVTSKIQDQLDTIKSQDIDGGVF